MLALNSIYCVPHIIWGFPCGSAGRESACNAGDLGSIPGLRKEWLPNPVFWPGEFHGLHSLWGGKESDMTEQLSLSYIILCALHLLTHLILIMLKGKYSYYLCL